MAKVRKTKTFTALFRVKRALNHKKLIMASSEALTEHQNEAVCEGTPLKNCTVSLGKKTYKMIDGNGPNAPRRKKAFKSLELICTGTCAGCFFLTVNAYVL